MATCYLEQGADGKLKLQESTSTDPAAVEPSPPEAPTTMAATLKAFLHLHEANGEEAFRAEFLAEILIKREVYRKFLTYFYSDMVHLNDILKLEDKPGDSRSTRKRPHSDSDYEG